VRAQELGAPSRRARDARVEVGVGRVEWIGRSGQKRAGAATEMDGTSTAGARDTSSCSCCRTVWQLPQKKNIPIPIEYGENRQIPHCGFAYFDVRSPGPMLDY